MEWRRVYLVAVVDIADVIGAEGQVSEMKRPIRIGIRSPDYTANHCVRDGLTAKALAETVLARAGQKHLYLVKPHPTWVWVPDGRSTQWSARGLRGWLIFN